MGSLYIVATPIGNLADVTLRALETLKEVDVVIAEDTRVTKKLLSRYEIEKPLVSYHQQSKENVQEKIFQLLSEEKDLALVTDAGTPGISDPGNELIAFLLEKDSEIKIVPIPGPSAITTLASVAGIPMDKFLFLGYPPHKRGRNKFFEEVVQSKHSVVFCESPHRILKSLQELQNIDNTLSLIVGRELTKQFETIYRGTTENVLQQLQQEKIQGEFVVLVDKNR